MTALLTGLSVELLQVGEIPALLALPGGARRAPVVFMVPGYGATKEVCLPLAYRLANIGMACVGFDPLHHGERYDPRLDRAYEPQLGGIFPQETGLDIYLNFLRCIRQASLDIARLMAHFARDPRVDVTRAGVTGHSQGGYASFLALADIPDLKAAVPMMGLPDFGQRWQDVVDESAWSNPAWAKAIEQVAEQAELRAAFISEINPAPRLLTLPPRPLRIISGDFDTDQPKGYILPWLRKLRPLYAAQPEMLDWIVYPVGHVITDQMLDDVANWFERWL
jgi:pimeloyl-ACP methyl ester carboxylesterase